jgi:glycosyltransferase involved in cell wall biosynthesis
MPSKSFPNVDVIIPFHRNDNLLRKSIESAHASLGVNVYLILVNDTGENVTAQSLQLKDTDQIVSTTNRGYTNALKVGMDCSTSDYVAFLDSDDLTHPDRIRKQIDLLLKSNADYASGCLIKFSNSKNFKKQASILGHLPRPVDSKLLLLFGAHGSDSTIVAKGASIRSSWHFHRQFPSSVADYGWLLSALNLGHTLVREESAVYFYRSHLNQLSRTDSLKIGWESVWPLWQKLKSDSKLTIPSFSQIQISKNAALALAFPASLPKMTMIEHRELKNAIEAFLVDQKNLDSTSIKLWEKTLWRRYIVAGRIRSYGRFGYLPGILKAFMFQNLLGIKIRKN